MLISYTSSTLKKNVHANTITTLISAEKTLRDHWVQPPHVTDNIVRYWPNNGLCDFQNSVLKKLGAQTASDVRGVCMKYPVHFASIHSDL